MTRYLLNVALIRIIFPAILVGCTIWRPVGLSLVYLLLALISPMVSVPTQLSMNGYTSRYFVASICLSFLVTLTQITFHVVLLALPPYGHFLKDCEYLEKILRHIGLVRLDSATPWEFFFWLSPEIIVFPSSVIIYCTCRRLTRVPLAEDDDNSSLQQHERRSKETSAKVISFLGNIGTYVVLATLCCVASLKPSAEGGLYFLVFIGSATWWACHRELRRGFAIICRFLMTVVAIHIVALLSYQNQWPQDELPMNGTWARYFGLEAIYRTDCKDPRDVIYVDNLEPSTYAYPSRLFLLYFVLALQSKFLFKKPAKGSTRLSVKLDTLDTPLSRHVSLRRRTPSQRWQSARRKARKPASELQSNQLNETTPLMRFGSGRAGLLQDSTGSVVIQDGQQDDSVHLQSLSEGVTEETPGIFEHIVMAIFSVFQLIVNSSYLATNIIMMTWSIMYHSWTTFALLLWALVLWLVPNKRAAMMKCSPFVVFYSTLLVLIQYVYSMDLNESELPTIIHGIKMADIGFKKTTELSCWHLIVKSLFMTMFWITMRQHYAEQKKQQRSSTLRDMVAPLQVTVSAATATMNAPEEPEIKSKFMKDVGIVVKKLLTKFWIAIVALMLFTSGITGDRMTVFRIVYMSLFLLFIVTFQMSWTVWRKMMYGFWITVIGYSVMMLILVYTYQFPDFKDYYEYYLHISENLQKDIGLIKYDTKDLFVRLLTPTFFVIISVLQMHYFHEDFLKITDIKRVSDDSRKDSYGPSPSTAPIVSSADVFSSDNEDDRPGLTLRDLKQMSKLERLALFRKITDHFFYIYNHIWLFLEIHMPKMIFLAFVLLCIDDICAINFCFILTVAVSVNFRRSIQTMIINVMTAAIAILMVAKMLYQIDYIHHDAWDHNCTEHNSSDDNTDVIKTYNMAEWIGFRKVAKGSTLPQLLEGYIYILAVTTIHAIIIIRQWFYRQERGELLTTPLVMFPNIKRVDADKGVVPCMKFLLNYGFYKFGLEISLIGIVTLIGYRLDVFSVLYCIWLMILFSLNRKVVASVWPFLTIFVMVVFPMQYAAVVAPPTWLCIDYPWRNSEILKGLQQWMYLPDPDSEPDPRKLLCDFFVLLMVVRQSIVFRIERRSDATGQEFAAGHNYSVYKDMEKPNFVNPVKDYVSHIHNWLDILKRGSMMSLMWIALSITFLAGTKRTNLFSLGYLIGSFVFLWQGSDFYLRPVHTILKWWNVLIGYNVFVIFCKTIFQGIGCIFIKNLEAHACILIQLLGIACMGRDPDDQMKSNATCEVNPSDMGLLWDGLCFAFLLLQKRLFRSYYFFHIVDETKAMTILASRGAELLEELHQKRILEQENAEKAMLQKIKFKMDKIKANQRKIHGPNYREPKTHKIGEAPLAHTSSVSSCISSGHTPPQGYRTPIDEDDEDDEETGDENEEDEGDVRRARRLLPSPNSAVMTVSLDHYLDPQRISFSSPPGSELNPRVGSPDETFPVFSPPPPSSAAGIRAPEERRASSLRRQSSTWTNRRPSLLSQRSPRSHQTYTLYDPLERPMYRRWAPKTHAQALRSGDYYMFDDMNDDDLTDLTPDKDASEEDQRRARARRMTVSELMNALIKTDIEIATHVALYGGTQKDAMKMRRRSEPVTRKKSSMSYLSARSDTDTAAATDVPEQAETLSFAEDATERGIDEIFDKSEKDSKGESKSKEPKVSFFTYFKFLWAFLNSIMVSMTRYLNRYSSDYRYIRKVLSKEKKILKAKPDFRMGTRLGISQMWQPLPIVTQRSSANESPDEAIEDPGEGPSTMGDRSRKRKQSALSVPHIRILAPSLERGLDISSSSSIFSHVTYPSEEDEEADLSEVDQPPIIQLAASIWLGILAHSTFLCYFMVFLHQINNASILSTPLPLMVFLWGSLTIPRPSKTFWIFLIAYIEVIVIIKCVFQFAFLSVNKIVTSPSAFTTSRIIGVERKSNYALYELLLLLVLFFHRIMLKSLGQWTRPSSKSRKIIPTGLTIATVKQSASGDDGKSLRKIELDNEHSGVRLNEKGEIKTPKGTTLRPHPREAGDGEIEAENGSSQVRGDNEKLVIIQTAERSLLEEDFSKAMKKTVVRYIEPMRTFYANILDPSGKEKTNVYAYMFFCDFFNFLLLMIGFSSFGAQQGDGGLTSYLAENRVPMQFLLIILVQFALIVIDRALFLKKSMAGKFWFHYFLIIGVHIWMFIVLPTTTERPFNANKPENRIPQIFYMVKCFYLLLAAYQLRLGYPTRILGNFLCRKFTIFNYCLFKGFMTVPFLFETRAVMDWIWTDTSMTAFDWFKMEDIFANIYQIKCMRGLENDYPQERGVKKTQMSKYLVGGGALLLMIGMIWFPLLLFALGGTVGNPNLPREVSLNIRIGSYEPIYKISAQSNSISPYSPENFVDLREIYEHTHADKTASRAAITFLDNYVYSDVAAVKLSTDSGSLWEISPPDKTRLIEELNSDNEMVIHVEWTVTRDPPSKDMSGVTSKIKDVLLPSKINGVQNPVRRDLIEAIDGNDTSQIRTGDIIEYKKKSVLLTNALPMFVKVTGRGMTVVRQLMDPLVQDKGQNKAESDNGSNYRDVTLVVTNNSLGQQWFSVNENCNDSIYDKKIPLNDCSYIVMFLFNDKVFPDSLSFISGLGILGLYTTAVILVSSYIKRLVSDVTPKIMFEDLPYVDRIMRLCLDIYLVRESGDLCLEEDLFAKLIFLFRSPETLIRWTRLPEPGEQMDNGDDENYNEIDNDGNGDEDEKDDRLRRRLRDPYRSSV